VVIKSSSGLTKKWSEEKSGLKREIQLHGIYLFWTEIGCLNSELDIK